MDPNIIIKELCYVKTGHFLTQDLLTIEMVEEIFEEGPLTENMRYHDSKRNLNDKDNGRVS